MDGVQQGTCGDDSVTMKEKPHKATRLGERFASRLEISRRMREYAVAVRKFDPTATDEQLVEEVREALNRTWGWVMNNDDYQRNLR